MPADKKLPELYFDGRTGDYWLRQSARRFIRLGARDVRLHFQSAKFCWGEECKHTGLKLGERLLVKTQIDKCVDYSGPLAGHRCGMVKLRDGRQLLVTSEPQLDVGKPKRRDWKFIGQFMAALLGREQMEWLLLWLKHARETLLNGSFQPGQCVVLAGPPECGKSFLQLVITELLGGRCACPYRYMMGLTTFNGDLAGAEHLAIEDKAASTDIRTRREFGARIKEFTVNERFSLHDKGKRCEDLPTFRRLTISVNDEPENLMIVPPLDSSLADKMSLIRCEPASELLNRDRKANIRALTAELPAMVAQLERLTCPQQWLSHRFGVRAYHDPIMLEQLTQVEDHIRLLSIIDEVVFDNPKAMAWEGTANELESLLRKSEYRFNVEKLCYFPGSCGTYLGRIKSKLPERVSSRVVRGSTRWTLSRPEPTE